MLSGGSPIRRVGMLGVLASVLVLAHTLWRGATLQPPVVHLGSFPAVHSTPTSLEIPIRPGASATRLEALVLHAVGRDPFRADRHRPPGRYGTLATAPGITSPVPPVQTEPVPPPVRLIALAAIVRGRGIAALQVGGAPARIVHVGDVVRGLRVLSIRRDEVRLGGADTVLVLRMTDSSPPLPVH